VHLISVIIPVHKTIPYLKECVASVLCQSHLNLEIILACNGSLIIEECQSFLGTVDERLLYIKTKPGRHNARNEALKIAKGDYIQFLDYDDILYPAKLEIQLDSLKRQPVDIVICKWKKFTKNLDEYYKFPFDSLFDLQRSTAVELINSLGENGGFIATAAYLFSRELALNAQWIDAPNDDAVYFSELSKWNPTINMVNKELVGYRIHDNNTSSQHTKSSLNKLIVGWKIIEKNLNFYKQSSKKKYLFQSYLHLLSISIHVENYKKFELICHCLKFSTSLKDIKSVARCLRS
jgi:glycosyltransferase involved in cell wall biosynthesis